MKFMKIMMSIFAIILMAIASFTLVNVNYVFFNNKGLSWNNNLQNNPDLVITDKSVKGLVNSVATAVGLTTRDNNTDFIPFDKPTVNEVYPYDYIRINDIVCFSGLTISEFLKNATIYTFLNLAACRYVVNNNFTGSFFFESSSSDSEGSECTYVRYVLTDSGIKLAISGSVSVDDDLTSIPPMAVVEINYTDTEKNSWECVFSGSVGSNTDCYFIMAGTGIKLTKFESYTFNNYNEDAELISITINAINHKKELRYGTTAETTEAYKELVSEFSSYAKNDFDRLISFFKSYKNKLYSPSFDGITTKDTNFDKQIRTEIEWMA